jgi:hypothetical protein
VAPGKNVPETCRIGGSFRRGFGRTANRYDAERPHSALGSDLIACTVCVGAREVVGVDRLRVPQFAVYPCECR